MHRLLLVMLLAAFGGALFAENDPFRLDIPLDEDESISLRFFGQHRTRAELRTPASYASDQGAVQNIHLRTRFGIEAHFPRNANFLFEIQDARFWGDQPRATSNVPQSSGLTGLDVLQANVYTTNLLDLGVEARLGRQRISIGNQRLFSPLEWSVTPRAWDGLTLRHSFHEDQWHLLGMAFLIDDEGAVSDDEWLIGGTVRWTPESMPRHDLELLYVFQHRDDPSGVLDLNVSTLGLRWNGHFDVTEDKWFVPTAEIVTQMGKADPLVWGTPSEDDSRVQTLAWALTADLFWQKDENNLWQLGLEWAFASGDSNPDDDRLGSFRAPFPFGHGYHGFADLVGWRNLHDVSLRAAWTTNPGEWAESLTLQARFHWFRRAKGGDGWYDPAGNLVRGGTHDDSRTIGHEIDLVATAKLSRWVTVELGYSHFFAGRFVRQTAGDNRRRDMDFLYAQLVLQF
jgi:hypothetical protein